jgi:hypothetical protein
MGTIHTSVAAVINFIDSVTQRPMKGKIVQVNIKQGNKIIWKDDSCAVILKSDNTNTVDIAIRSGIYRGFDIHLDLKVQNSPMIYYEWLTPTMNYPFTSNMAVVRGVGKGGEVLAAMITESTSIKLIGDTDNTNKIKLWGVEGSIENKKLLLRENTKEQVITLLNRCDDEKDCYYTNEKIKKNFHKGETLIYPVTMVRTGQDGEYIMAYMKTSGDEEIEIL